MTSFNQSPPIPPEIVDAAQDGSLVLFIGAGISRLVGGPSWDEFAGKVLAQLTPTPLDYHQQRLLKSISDPRKQLSLAKIIEKVSQKKINYHKIFTEIDIPAENIYKYINRFECSFVTTNYDKLIEPENVNGRPETEWRIYNRSGVLAANLDVPGNVMHLHGCVDSPENMIITTKDYLDHYSSDEVPAFLEHLFSKKTVLFLGYGLEELEILEYVLKSARREPKNQFRLFILQGFFNADNWLFEQLRNFYLDSFHAQLIGFPLDFESHRQQVEIIKKWVEKLKFNDPALIDEATMMLEELHE